MSTQQLENSTTIIVQVKSTQKNEIDEKQKDQQWNQPIQNQLNLNIQPESSNRILIRSQQKISKKLRQIIRNIKQKDNQQINTNQQDKKLVKLKNKVKNIHQIEDWDKLETQNYKQLTQNKKKSQNNLSANFYKAFPKLSLSQNEQKINVSLIIQKKEDNFVIKQQIKQNMQDFPHIPISPKAYRKYSDVQMTWSNFEINQRAKISKGFKKLMMKRAQFLKNHSQKCDHIYIDNIKIPIFLTQSNNKIANQFQSQSQQQSEKVFIRCNICQNDFTQDQMFKMCKCDHMYCQNCLKSYINVRIQRFQLVICPQENCQEQFYKINLKFRQSVCTKYEKIKRFYRVSKDPNLRICPSTDCQGILKIKAEQNEVNCKICKKQFCSKCFLIKHQGSCQVNEMDYFFQKLKIKPCPKCDNYIQKSRGCNHMQCICKYEFCFLCGGRYSESHKCTYSQNLQIQYKNNIKNAKINPQNRSILNVILGILIVPLLIPIFIVLTLTALILGVIYVTISILLSIFIQTPFILKRYCSQNSYMYFFRFILSFPFSAFYILYKMLCKGWFQHQMSELIMQNYLKALKCIFETFIFYIHWSMQIFK